MSFFWLGDQDNIFLYSIEYPTIPNSIPIRKDLLLSLPFGNAKEWRKIEGTDLFASFELNRRLCQSCLAGIDTVLIPQNPYPLNLTLQLKQNSYARIFRSYFKAGVIFSQGFFWNCRKKRRVQKSKPHLLMKFGGEPNRELVKSAKSLVPEIQILRILEGIYLSIYLGR